MTSFDNLFLVLAASTAGILNLICFLLLFWFLDAASHFYYSPLLMAIAIVPQTIGGPCLLIFIDLIKKERVSSVKLSVLFLIEGLLLILTFWPGGMEVIPGYGVHIVGPLRILQVIFLIYYVMIFFSWSYLTWKRAPKELKQLVNFLLFGSILFSFVTAFIYGLGGFIKIFNPHSTF